MRVRFQMKSGRSKPEGKIWKPKREEFQGRVSLRVSSIAERSSKVGTEN